MDLGLHNKVVIVTGASRGIGRAIATGFAQEGCRLVLCARGEEELAAAADELSAIGADVLPMALDVTSHDAPKLITAKTMERFGAIDAFVSNVGGNCRKPLAETLDEDWTAVLDSNLLCHVRLSREVIPHMKSGGGGAILFTASIFGREAGGPGLSIYNSTKSALISLAKIMALELAADGIRVNSLAPGSIRFPGGSWDRRVKADPDGMRVFVQQNLPLGRFGTAEEVAHVAVFLCSPRASLMTGACVNVDGCQSHSLI
jgi:3-oxoacyl-[acyl-carrier protein] reductase